MWVLSFESPRIVLNGHAFLEKVLYTGGSQNDGFRTSLRNGKKIPAHESSQRSGDAMFKGNREFNVEHRICFWCKPVHRVKIPLSRLSGVRANKDPQKEPNAKTGTSWGTSVGPSGKKRTHSNLEGVVQLGRCVCFNRKECLAKKWHL